MGTIFQLLDIYTSLYNVSIDFEELSLYEYQFTIMNNKKDFMNNKKDIMNNEKNIMNNEKKLIKFIIKQKKENIFTFYYFIFDKLFHYYKYLGNLSMEHFDLIELEDNIETKTFLKLLSREKFNDLTDFVDSICYYGLTIDDICPNCLDKKVNHSCSVKYR